MYIHRQFGWFTVFALTAMAVWFALVAAVTPGERGEFQSILLIIAALQVVFYQLTTIVTESTLTVRYGIGLVAFRFPLSEITQVTERTVPWYAGYGIRWVGDAWLFNVSGRDAIEVTFASGRKLWVGTDDPDGLAAVLRQRMEELRKISVDADNDASDDASASVEAEPVVGETTDVDDAAADVEPTESAIDEVEGPQTETPLQTDSE
ncbi:MAG: hypothetical protein RL169_448 [Armatimonadota bacterium]|jgi:hypothetical protein